MTQSDDKSARPAPDDLFGDTPPQGGEPPAIFASQGSISAEKVRFAPSSREWLVDSYIRRIIALRLDYAEVTNGSAQLHAARQMIDLGIMALMVHEGIPLPEKSLMNDQPPGAALVDSLSAIRNVLKTDHGPVALRSVLDSPAPLEFTADDGAEAIGFVDEVVSAIITRIAPHMQGDWQYTQPVFGDFED